MTPIAGLIIAIIAGLMVANGRRSASVVLVPWLVVLAYQSRYIASGRAISPPRTVTQFPGAIGYWLVQVIILAPALGIAAQLGASGQRRHPVSAAALARRAWLASAFSVAAAVIVIVFGFVLFPHEGGTVAAGHHSSNGSPPLIGMVGIVGSFLGCAALGVRALVWRRTDRRAASVAPVRETATAAARR